MTLRIITEGLKSLFRGRQLNQEMDEELQSFLDSMVEEKMRGGMNRDEALREAHAEMGSVDAVKQKVWAVGWESVVENLWRDLSFSARLLRKSPGFTAVAVLTLTLGVGANTAVFSLINALLLRPLPVPHAEQLTVIGYERTNVDRRNYSFASPIVRAFEKRLNVFQSVGAFCDFMVQVRGSSGNEEVPGAQVSGQFFSVMQVPPLIGRYLTPQDDQPGGGSTGFGVVISERFWRTWFNASPNVIGQKIIAANAPFTVVGVMPKHFIGADPTERPEIYFPLWSEPILDAPYNYIADGFNSTWLRMIARRAPGVSREQANAAVEAASNPIVRAASDADWSKGALADHFRFIAEPGVRGQSAYSTIFRKPLLAVFALCGLMMLLACLNLASLLMARAAARERELVTRLAVGASRKRLVQQFLVESLLISILGTMAGLAVVPITSHALVALLFGNRQEAVLDTRLDIRVLFFTLCIAWLASALIGLVPALRATGGNLTSQLKDGAHTTSVRERRRLLPRILLGSEVALALILVTGAGLLATSLARLYETDLGFDPKNVIRVGLSMDKQDRDGEALVRWYETFGDAMKGFPGVKRLSFTAIDMLGYGAWTRGYQTPGSGGEREIYMNAVAPEYFATMHIPLLEGRDFQWNDTRITGRKIILNRTAAKLLFSGQNPIGQRLNGTNHTNGPFSEVIAIVGDVKYRSIRQGDPPEAYVPITQSESKKPSYTAVVRLEGPVAPFAAAVRRLTAQMAPDIPAPVFTTMSSQIDSSIGSERMMAMLSVFFAICALLVTAIGLYGTLSYATARRTSEIGIRIALGAQRWQVVSLIFRENAWVASVGGLAGLAVALVSLRVLASFLYGISAHDPWVMMFSLLILEAVASAASLIPAVRASRIEPITAIRCE
jgi:predicted permease